MAQISSDHKKLIQTHLLNSFDTYISEPTSVSDQVILWLAEKAFENHPALNINMPDTFNALLSTLPINYSGQDKIKATETLNICHRHAHIFRAIYSPIEEFVEKEVIVEQHTEETAELKSAA